MPNSAATRSKRATATSPQFRAPTITRTDASTSRLFISFLAFLLIKTYVVLLKFRSAASRVHAVKRSGPFCTLVQTEKKIAVADTAGRAEGLRDRAEDPGDAPEEEDRPGGAREAHP